jgi:hypothetical protein
VIRKILFSLAIFCGLSSASLAQNLPAGALGTVAGNTPNQFSNYSYDFTAAQTGSYYILFAFRQDPAFWTFGNVSLTAAGSSTNMLYNGNMASGGTTTVPLGAGTTTVTAPTGWGVFYQTGTVPAAAGSWQATGGPNNSGAWYDGAVGSYDGIYQGVSVTNGTQYTIGFSASGNNVASNPSIMIGTYAGVCATLTIAPAQCTLPSTLGFTTLATPAQGQNATTPGVTPPVNTNTTPTVTGTSVANQVSTSRANGTSTQTTVVTRGTTVNSTASVNGSPNTNVAIGDVGANGVNNITVTRTITTTVTTPVTTTVTQTTPVTTTVTTRVPTITTTTTIPVTTTNYSDGTSTTSNGTPVVTTATTYTDTPVSTTTNQVTYVVTNSNNIAVDVARGSNSVSSNGFSDAVKIRNTNPLLVDALSQKDGGWADPIVGYFKATSNISKGGVIAGYQWTVENNTFGVAGGYASGKSGGLNGSTVESTDFNLSSYMLSRQDIIWVKGTIGAGLSSYNGTTSMPIFALYNNTKFKQNTYYADLTVYTADTYYGFRPLVGATVNQSQLNNIVELGSPLLSSIPNKTSTSVNPYVGVRYDLDNNISFETRVTQTKDFKTVGRVRAVAKTEIDKGVFLNATIGFDKGKDYTAAVGTIGLKIDF